MRRPFSYVSNPYAPYHWVYCGPPPPPDSGNQYNRKKQRRQAAAAGVVQSLWGSNANQNMGRKSTAQPRPVLNVPPGGIGPIATPNENDVLCGRGGRINSHVGNVQFRDIIYSRKKEYLAKTTKKLEKAHIAAAIVNDIRSMQPPGRFLKEESSTGMWYDIGDAKAIKKTGQALREDAPDIRPEIDVGAVSSDGDENGGDEQDKKAVSSPKDNATRPRKSKSPKSRNQKSPPVAPVATPQAFGPQLLPPGVWPNQAVQDHQGQAAMPPPFQSQVNPYMMQQQQQLQLNTFEPRNIPIQAPQNAFNMPNQIYSGGRSVGTMKGSSTVSKHALDALGAGDDNTAFGKTFYPPSSAIGSEKTMSTISGLTDPAHSNISSLSGSGMGSNFSQLSPTAQLRQTARIGSLQMGQIFPGELGSSAGFSSSRMSEMSSSIRMSDAFRSGDIAGSFHGSILRSSSFPDMASMSSIVDHDSWKAIMEDDEDPRSMLSGNSRESSNRISMMSIGSMASSGQWMNASYDGRSVLSEMSSDLNALDLAG